MAASTRETKNDATDPIGARSRPAACARSSPDRYASRTLPYRSREKISVTLTLMPSAIALSIAARPCSVAGILMNTFGRSMRAHSSRACAMVASPSRARRGSTSIETRPSTVPVRS